MKKILASIVLVTSIVLADNSSISLQDNSTYKMFFDLAKSGDVDAQTMLGEMYLDGLNAIEKDYEKAFFWLSKAARSSEPQAEYLLGFMYENGLYVAKDIEKAVYWYKKAAHQGDVLAQYNLALIYKEGKGNIRKNSQEAFKWLQMVQLEEKNIMRVSLR